MTRHSVLAALLVSGILAADAGAQTSGAATFAPRRESTLCLRVTAKDSGRMLAEGSGFVVAPNGSPGRYVLTALHVIYPDDQRLADQQANRTITVESLRSAIAVTASRDECGTAGAALDLQLISPDADLALLLLPESAVPYPSVRLFRVAQPVGEAASIFGVPHGFSLSISNGVVTGRGFPPQLKDRTNRPDDWLQTSATLNPGQSGGPAFNDRGCVIGVAWGGVPGLSNMSWAIPIEQGTSMLGNRGITVYEASGDDACAAAPRGPHWVRSPTWWLCGAAGGAAAWSFLERARADDHFAAYSAATEVDAIRAARAATESADRRSLMIGAGAAALGGGCVVRLIAPRISGRSAGVSVRVDF